MDWKIHSFCGTERVAIGPFVIVLAQQYPWTLPTRTNFFCLTSKAEEPNKKISIASMDANKKAAHPRKGSKQTRQPTKDNKKMDKGMKKTYSVVLYKQALWKKRGTDKRSMLITIRDNKQKQEKSPK